MAHLGKITRKLKKWKTYKPPGTRHMRRGDFYLLPGYWINSYFKNSMPDDKPYARPGGNCACRCRAQSKELPRLLKVTSPCVPNVSGCLSLSLPCSRSFLKRHARLGQPAGRKRSLDFPATSS